MTFPDFQGVALFFFSIINQPQIERGSLNPSKQIIKETELVVFWHIAKDSHLVHLFHQG